MLNFTSNSIQKFTERSGQGSSLFAVQRFAYNELPMFEFSSLGGTDISSFFAIRTDKNYLIYDAIELSTDLIFYNGTNFHSDAGEEIGLEKQSMYYFQIIDNVGNVYYSEPFLTFEPEVFVQSEIVGTGGSLNVRTNEFFEFSQIFALSQFSVYQSPNFSLKNIENENSISNFDLLLFEPSGLLTDTIAQNTNLVSITNDEFIVNSFEFAEKLISGGIYCFRITTASAVFYTDYFKTLNENTNINAVVSFDIEKGNLFNTLTTFDGTANNYFDFSQQ
jgi:hypothetical protein